MPATQDFQERVARIEQLVQNLDSAADPATRATATELVQTLMALHGAALERILEVVSQSSDGAGAGLVELLGRDELVSNLLVLYDLHPEGFETRAHRALDKVRVMLRSRDARLEGVQIGDGTVRARMTGALSEDLKKAVRQALLESVPDAVEVIIEGDGSKAAGAGFVPLSSLLAIKGSGTAIAGER